MLAKIATVGPQNIININTNPGALRFFLNYSEHVDKGVLTFMYTSAKGDTETVEKMIKEGAGGAFDSRFFDSNHIGLTPLMLASINGSLEVVKVLLENKAAINATTEDGQTALIHASRNGHLEIVKLLLENGAEVDVRDENGQAALLFAAENGFYKIVELLLANGADVEACYDNWSAILGASRNGHLKVVELLLANGAEVNIEDDPHSALEFAAENGHLEVVKLLVENGAQIDAINCDEQTPLMLTVINDHPAVVKYLLEEGVEKISDDEIRNCITEASLIGRLEILKLLLEKASDAIVAENVNSVMRLACCSKWSCWNSGIIIEKRS